MEQQNSYSNKYEPPTRLGAPASSSFTPSAMAPLGGGAPSTTLP